MADKKTELSAVSIQVKVRGPTAAVDKVLTKVREALGDLPTGVEATGNVGAKVLKARPVKADKEA